MALQIYQIIRYRLANAGIEVTTQQALEELEEIICYYTKIAGKDEAIRHINPITNLQKNILKSLQIKIFD